ncbi:hypothetical protein PENSPDRAFT_736230 [Peniophora sp. CONT]|nr:hypothetical protein PENSPDRAFT_736230 [Peniophora sp. CONT]
MDGEDGMPNPISPASPVTSAVQKRISLYNSLSFEKGNSSAETFRTLESELREIETVLASLRRQRNALAPGISCIPPELLSHIFHYLTILEPHYAQKPDEYERASAGDLQTGLGWIKVTQVCHVWRQVTFSDSQLWTTTTVLLGEKWFDRMLELSRRQPREMDLYLNNKTGAGILTQCPHVAFTAGLMDKVSRLRILGEQIDLSELKDLHAPLIKSLHVHLRYSGGGQGFPNTLFRHQDLRLKDLYVHNLAVDLNAPFLRSIVYLSLTFDHDVTYSIAFRGIADLLGRLEALESLTTQGYTYRVVDDDIPSTNAMDIVCPRLTNVNINASGWPGVLLLISRLRPSVTARMTFATHYPQHELDEWNHVFAHFKRRILDPQLSPVCNMQTIEWCACAPYSWRNLSSCRGPGAPRYEKSFMLSTWRDNCPNYLLRDYASYDDPSSPLPDFQLILQVPSVPELAILPLDEFIPFKAFPAARNVSLRPVHRLCFEIMYDVGWKELFRTAKTLEWLRMDRNVAERFLLISHTRHFDASGRLLSRKSCFPKTLRTLALLGVRWHYNFDGLSTDPMKTLLNDLGHHDQMMKQPIGEIIVGKASYEDGAPSCNWKGVKLSAVERPDWFTPVHEDWDEMADF